MLRRVVRACEAGVVKINAAGWDRAVAKKSNSCCGSTAFGRMPKWSSRGEASVLDLVRPKTTKWASRHLCSINRGPHLMVVGPDAGRRSGCVTPTRSATDHVQSPTLCRPTVLQNRCALRSELCRCCNGNGRRVVTTAPAVLRHVHTLRSVMSDTSGSDGVLSSVSGSVTTDGSLSVRASRIERRCLAKSTRRHRASVMRQFNEFREARSLPFDQRSAIKFVHHKVFAVTRPITVTSAVQYASVLGLALATAARPIERLVNYRNGLRRTMRHAVRRALPMSLVTLRLLLNNPRVTPMLRAAFALMWSTASRWSDIVRLTGNDIRIDQECIFGANWRRVRK